MWSLGKFFPNPPGFNRFPPTRPVLLNYQEFGSAKFLIIPYQGGVLEKVVRDDGQGGFREGRLRSLAGPGGDDRGEGGATFAGLTRWIGKVRGVAHSRRSYFEWPQHERPHHPGMDSRSGSGMTGEDGEIGFRERCLRSAAGHRNGIGGVGGKGRGLPTGRSGG